MGWKFLEIAGFASGRANGAGLVEKNPTGPVRHPPNIDISQNGRAIDAVFIPPWINGVVVSLAAVHSSHQFAIIARRRGSHNLQISLGFPPRHHL